LRGRNDRKSGLVVNVGNIAIATINDELKRAREAAFSGLVEEVELASAAPSAPEPTGDAQPGGPGAPAAQTT
jgi:hypothetical protein